MMTDRHFRCYVVQKIIFHENWPTFRVLCNKKRRDFPRDFSFAYDNNFRRLDNIIITMIYDQIHV